MVEHIPHDEVPLQEGVSLAEREAFYVAKWNRDLANGTTPPLHHQLQLQIVQLSPHVVLTMELSNEVRGLTPGSIHGGMLASFADIAGAVSLWDSFVKDVEIPVTSDMHIRYYRQPKGGPIRAEAHLVHKGTRLLSNQCVIADAQERLLARTTATYLIQPLRR